MLALFLGSVSREVVQRSSRPVLIVKEGTEIGQANSYAGRAFA